MVMAPNPSAEANLTDLCRIAFRVLVPFD
jgi:hypothetical protein